jgi:hypothetical protein
MIKSIIHIASKYNIIAEGLMLFDIDDEIVDEGFAGVDGQSASLIEPEALLMPGGDTKFVSWLDADLIYCVDDQWWPATAPEGDMAPSAQRVA